MKKLIGQLYENSVIRYLFFGGCTTMVNMVSFYILRQLQVGLNIANVISIVLAIIFAFVVNSKYVFLQKYERIREYIRDFIKFVGARSITMFIEVAGVWFFVDVVCMNEMLGKLVIQFIIIVLNYVFSKVFVFKK